MRQKTEAFTLSSLTYTPSSGTTKQDCAYTYDLAGNIVGMVDKTTECAVGGTNATNPDELIRIFAYDALYRLIYATGREAGSHVSTSDPNFRPTPDTSAGGTVAYYREYTYDKLGNMLDLYHHGGTGNQFHRVFNSASSTPFELSNLATDIEYAGTVVNYTFDDNGNMLTEGAGRSFEWDFADQLRGFAEGTTTAAYYYDAGGNRVKKVVRKSASLKEVTVYIDGGFEYLYTLDGTNTVDDEYNEIHVMDGRSRVARIKVENGIADEVKYNLEDHLGNASFTLSEAGSLINREEYFPFGETSFGSYLIKRYRYNGKERDEESGLYYYGARYYAPWTCRFVSLDPLAGSMPDSSPNCYAANNPVVLVDVDGLAPGGGQEKSKPPANLAKPAITRDDHGMTTRGAVEATDRELDRRVYATRCEINVDHLGEQQDVEDAWLENWGSQSAGERWASQDKAYAIKNRQNYDKWVAAGNDPEKFHPISTPMQVWEGVNEAAFYSLGGVKGEILKGNEKPIARFTGAYSPSPVAVKPLFGYKLTTNTGSVTVPAKGPANNTKLVTPTPKNKVGDGKALPGINTSTSTVPQVKINYENGKTFEKDLGTLLEKEGFDIEYGVTMKTMFGDRVLDIVLSKNGQRVGAIECKTGNSPHTVDQRNKDWAIKEQYGLDVVLIRKPNNW
ncbi:MAG: RHS repeat-associated core domain-containing protein [Bacteroidetes bacterium]|nr:RHS repeat-associated core domain-containing protein [Bacteroidota bacterium]